jgi:hypothetical protein
MANVYTGPQIKLDDFTSAINVNTSCGYASGTMLFVKSIEWQTPTSTSHTALVTDDLGQTVFSEQCTTANQSIIKYPNQYFQNLKMAVSGAGSGTILITLG